MTTVYFSQEHLHRTIWPALSMWKIVRLPIVERFEFIGITTWIVILLPNICLSCWAASRGVKEIFSLRQKSIIPWFLGLIFMMTIFISDRRDIEYLNKMVSNTGFYTVFIYIPVFFILYHIQYRMRK